MKTGVIPLGIPAPHAPLAWPRATSTAGCSHFAKTAAHFRLSPGLSGLTVLWMPTERCSALNTQPASEHGQVVDRELKRLDALEARIRSRDAADPEKLDRRVGAVNAMRDLLRTSD